MIAIMAQTDSTHLTLADDQTPPPSLLKTVKYGGYASPFQGFVGGKVFLFARHTD